MDRPLKKPRRRWLRRVLTIWLLVSAAGTLASCVRLAVTDGSQSRVYSGGGGTDRRVSAGLAPPADTHFGAVVQVYAARTWGVKRALSVHTWIATKEPGADAYTTYQVIGWRLRRAGTALVVEQGIPDRPWYGNTPELLFDARDAEAEALIDPIEQAVAAYPYATDYQAWPGPNSNTFTAFVARRLPQMALDLPSTAIGKDYLGDRWVSVSTDGGGWQWSLAGLAGLAMGTSVGLELNLLALNLEFDLADGAVELPGIGRLGPKVVDPPIPSSGANESAPSP